MEDNTYMAKSLMKTIHSKDTHGGKNSEDILNAETLADDTG